VAVCATPPNADHTHKAATSTTMTIATPAMTRRALVSGSLLPIWDDLLPDYPADIAEADARTVAATLLASFGGRLATADPT